jgi:ketosteroid isomerase-like protein
MSMAHHGRIQKDVAEEVALSLKHGDHLRHKSQLFRAVVSFVMLFALLFTRKRAFEMPEADMTFALANPVAHGSRFGLAVMGSLRDRKVNLVGDRRLAHESIIGEMSHFPSLTVRSLKGLVNGRTILRAIRLRMNAAIQRAEYPTLGRLYLESLFLVQAIRYQLAEEYVQAASVNHLWLSDFDRSAYCRPLIWQARALGRPTATLVHGSPSKHYLPPIAENILAWGDAQASWFDEVAPQCTVRVVGRPELKKEVPAGRPQRLRIMHSLERLSDDERRSFLHIYESAKRRGMPVSLRMHPSANETDLDADWLALLPVYEVENHDLGLVESFRSGDVVVGVTSTAIIDALACGLPAWTLSDTSRQLPADLVTLREYGPSIHRDVFQDQGDSGVGVMTSMPTLDGVRTAIVAAKAKESAMLIRRAVSDICSDHNFQ